MGSNDQRSTIRKVAVHRSLGLHRMVRLRNLFVLRSGHRQRVLPWRRPGACAHADVRGVRAFVPAAPHRRHLLGQHGRQEGRKWALSTSIFLMTGATFCIGLLPGYLPSARRPIFAAAAPHDPGCSASGEYAGAATFLAEYAPSDKRGVYCSLVPASTAVGLLVALRSPRSCTRSCLTQP